MEKINHNNIDCNINDNKIVDVMYLQTSLDFENLDDLITSGAIHAHVPAADIRMLSSV